MRAIFLLLLFAPRLFAAESAAYWVWHRGDPLRQPEIAELRRQETGALFWNIGELENRDGD